MLPLLSHCGNYVFFKKYQIFPNFIINNRAPADALVYEHAVWNLRWGSVLTPAGAIFGRKSGFQIAC
jgi:hypothetical protein